eukprot:14821429-Alexandrium_andersonii.AAC.1
MPVACQPRCRALQAFHSEGRFAMAMCSVGGDSRPLYVGSFYGWTGGQGRVAERQATAKLVSAMLEEVEQLK